ncbi:hypothetical protein LZP96_09665 [Enterobacteriaceae bacterium 155047]|uniref:hypothetical protein n=1 Tax=Huaxiibacter chinensis TaxID=2899785 RepID=UPI0021646066|nr:hypothetical protein [Huaxiibacter chinensis]MCG5044305.1 hypothetical protein [Huaxiibacter chinensis]
MSTITREFSKEQLIARINRVTAIKKYRISRDPDADGLAMDNELLAIALASLEAEPVADVVAWSHPSEERTCDIRWRRFDVAPGLPYTAPLAPVVPDLKELEAILDWILLLPCPTPKATHMAKRLAVVIDANRAAMLQAAEPVTTAYKLPMQPLVIDSHGTLRFKENPIVRTLLDYATEHGYGLNEIAREEFDAEDQMQLAQLIGYSLSGYGTLSYVTDESYDRAASAAPQQEELL